MATRAKAEKREKKGKGEAARAMAQDGAAQRKSRQLRIAKVIDVENKSSSVPEKARLDEVGFGVLGMGKTSSLHPSFDSAGRDRGFVPPPLPVPIASFTI